MPAIAIGDRVPDLSLSDQDGKMVSMSDFHGKRAVVLYFYPKDNTPGCTVEACKFRDAYEDFSDAGAEVVGVSSDSRDSHQAFASARRLPFTLLADEAGELRRAFGVPKTLGLLPGRVTYVIDRKSVVRHIFNSQLFFDRHVSEALAVVRTLVGEG